MLSTEETTVTISRDLLLQFQLWIDELFQLVDPRVSLALKTSSLKTSSQDETELTQKLQPTLDSINSLASSSIITERENTDNVIALLEKLREVCEQHLLVTNTDIFKQNGNETADKNFLQGQPEENASLTFAVDLAKDKQQKLKKDLMIDTKKSQFVDNDVNSDRIAVNLREENLDGGISCSIKRQCQELKAQMLQRHQERIAATEVEYEAYIAVLTFEEKYGNLAYELAAEWINKAAENIELRRLLLETELRWEYDLAIRQPTENLRTQIQEERLAKKKKVKDIRAHLAAFDKRKARLRPEFQSPGHYALKYWSAKEPVNKWAGPRQDLRLQSDCNICGLTGVARSDNCPNYSQHCKWLDGFLEEYKYS